MKSCASCSSTLLYNERWDCYYCINCDTWSETKCGNKECFYCVGRPKNPTHGLKLKRHIRNVK